MHAVDDSGARLPPVPAPQGTAPSPGGDARSVPPTMGHRPCHCPRGAARGRRRRRGCRRCSGCSRPAAPAAIWWLPRDCFSLDVQLLEQPPRTLSRGRGGVLARLWTGHRDLHWVGSDTGFISDLSQFALLKHFLVSFGSTFPCLCPESAPDPGHADTDVSPVSPAWEMPMMTCRTRGLE